MTKNLKHLAVLAVLAFGAKAQDVFLTNPNQSLIYLNPSFAGSNGSLRGQLNYRNENPNLSGRYVTYYAAVDGYIKPMRAGLALSVMTDDQNHGLLKTQTASLTYARPIKLGNQGLELIPSIQISYLQLRLDISAISFDGVINSRYNTRWNNGTAIPGPIKRNVDATTGLMIRNKNFNAGVVASHITQPDIGLLGTSRLPLKLTAHASHNFAMSVWTIVNISGLVNYQNGYWFGQGAITLTNAQRFMLGLGYRSTVTPFVFMGYKAKRVSLQLCYGRNYSVIAGSPFAELGLTYTVTKNHQTQNAEDR